MHARTHVYICISIILLFNILIKNRLYNRYIFLAIKTILKHEKLTTYYKWLSIHFVERLKGCSNHMQKWLLQKNNKTAYSNLKLCNLFKMSYLYTYSL